jgi:hypothetical protein
MDGFSAIAVVDIRFGTLQVFATHVTGWFFFAGKTVSFASTWDITKYSENKACTASGNLITN